MRMPAPEWLPTLSAIVVADETLQTRMLATSTRDEFVDLVVAVAQEHGLLVSGGDVEYALTERRRARLERWV
jgi:hypothetical protein